MSFRSLSAYSKNFSRRNHASHDPRCRVAGPQTEVCILGTYLFEVISVSLYLSINNPSPTRLISGRSEFHQSAINQSITQYISGRGRKKGKTHGSSKARNRVPALGDGEALRTARRAVPARDVSEAAIALRVEPRVQEAESRSAGCNQGVVDERDDAGHQGAGGAGSGDGA
jgi:hypothetical protein